MTGNNKDIYLITPSLLNSWKNLLEKEYVTVEDFNQVLNREPTPSSESIEKGFMFEKWCENHYPETQGGVFQYAAKKPISFGNMEFLLYGRMDCIKAGIIYDFKYTANYECGKYYGNPQTSAYLELLPEASEVKYVVTNKADTDGIDNTVAVGNIFTESYNRGEIRSITNYITEFMNWLELHGYMDRYKEKWAANEMY